MTKKVFYLTWLVQISLHHVIALGHDLPDLVWTEDLSRLRINDLDRRAWCNSTKDARVHGVGNGAAELRQSVKVWNDFQVWKLFFEVGKESARSSCSNRHGEDDAWEIQRTAFEVGWRFEARQFWLESVLEDKIKLAESLSPHHSFHNLALGLATPSYGGNFEWRRSVCCC